MAEMLPRHIRKIGYLVIMGLLVAHGAVGAGFAAADVVAPAVFDAIGGVLQFVAAAPLVVALFNLPEEEVALPRRATMDAPEDALILDEPEVD